jgi:hypothetical protein
LQTLFQDRRREAPVSFVLKVTLAPLGMPPPFIVRSEMERLDRSDKVRGAMINSWSVGTTGPLGVAVARSALFAEHWPKDEKPEPSELLHHPRADI